jgi:tetratricopeptide (TPR) repeat protein
MQTVLTLLSRYWGVFWVDASSEENVESGFAVIGTQAGKGASKASAIHWLSQSKLPWLLVLDNADDPDLDLSAYYPSEGNGHILITTRNPNAIEHATVGHLRFRGMEPSEAVILLLKAAYPNASLLAPPTSPMRWQFAEGIAIELGYLPLAIAHAGATVRRNIYTLERYLKYYLPQRKAMLSHSRVVSVDEANIITTWEIPFQKIISRASVEHRDAVDLMHMFAFMHHETIPERIFQRSWADIRSSQTFSAKCPDVLQSVWSEAARARFRRAIRVLCDHSIIEYEPTQGLCTMHPVVHNWARDRLSDAEQMLWLHWTTAILSQCISPNLEASGREFRTLLLPHINSCLHLQKSQTSREPVTLRHATELETFAWVYAEQGQWRKARQLQERVVHIRTKLLGRQHGDTIRAQGSLGQSLWNLFDIRAAIEVQRGILDALRWHRPHLSDWAIWPVWKPTHVSYCLGLSEITATLWLAGERPLSKWTGERAVAGLKERLGPEDPLTLKAMFHLARTYLHLGEEEKCRELLVWVLRRQKRFFGMRHPDTLMTRNELGMLLCASKKHLFAAQKLVENVLQERRQILGEEHAYTLWSVNDLSKIYIETGRTHDAVIILEAIVPIVVRTLGEDHVGMNMTRTNLAKAYFMSERWKEAEETVRPSLVGIPQNHPDWIHTMYGYSHILFKLGRMDDAEKRCNEMMDKITQTKSFPPSHPRTISIAELLLNIYRHRGDDEKIAIIKEKVPAAGVAENQDQFDPYAIRRSPQASQASQSSHSNQQDTPNSTLNQTESRLASKYQAPKRDLGSKLVTRRTF